MNTGVGNTGTYRHSRRHERCLANNRRYIVFFLSLFSKFRIFNATHSCDPHNLLRVSDVDIFHINHVPIIHLSEVALSIHATRKK